MERNIDAMGRIVIPSEYRKQLRIYDGDLLNMEVDSNKIVITKVNSKPSDIRREKVVIYDEKRIEALKNKYPLGTIVECIEMKEMYSPVPTGTRGVIYAIDDIGSIHTHWENGSSLALLEDIDRFKIVK